MASLSRVTSAPPPALPPSLPPSPTSWTGHTGGSGCQRGREGAGGREGIDGGEGIDRGVNTELSLPSSRLINHSGAKGTCSPTTRSSTLLSNGALHPVVWKAISAHGYIFVNIPHESHIQLRTGDFFLIHVFRVEAEEGGKMCIM